MSERQAGWYWVKWDNETAEPSWCPSWWCVDEGAWWVEECYQSHADVVSIGPRIPTPDEEWQCVPVEVTPPMRRAGQHALEHQCYIDGIYSDIIAAAPKP